MEGWLTKKGGRISSWRRRWFVMSADRVDYFTEQDKKVNKGYIANKDLIEVGHILHETRSFCIGLRTEKRLYVVSCEDEVSFGQWLAAFQAIQPKELDSEFTNVPHSSIGNIEKQWLSLVGGGKKKTKTKDGRETNMDTMQPAGGTSSAGGAKDSPPSSGSKQGGSGSSSTVTPPDSANAKRASRTGSDPTIASSSSPAGTPRAITASGEQSDSAKISGNAAPASPADSSGTSSPTTSHHTSLSQPQQQLTATTISSPSGSQSGNISAFAALHTSFDLDLSASLNPALMASPLEDSPFAEQPAQTTITVPTLTPILASEPSPEESPFE